MRAILALALLLLVVGCSKPIEGRVARVEHGRAYMDIVLKDGRFIRAINTNLLDTGDFVIIRTDCEPKVTHIWSHCDVIYFTYEMGMPKP